MRHVKNEHPDSFKPSKSTPVPQPDFLEQLIASTTQQFPNGGVHDIQFDGTHKTVHKYIGVPILSYTQFVPAWHVEILAYIVCDKQGPAMDFDTGEVPNVPNFLDNGDWQNLVCSLLRFMIESDFQLFINVVKKCMEK